MSLTVDIPRNRAAPAVTRRAVLSPRGPAGRRPPARHPGGFGLRLVQRLSERWSVRERPSDVWFGIDRDHAEGPP
jgi:hypothetical protein